LSARSCAIAFERALDRDFPDVIAVAGYARPEAMAGVRWASRNGRLAILMSESQQIDRTRVWWKEVVKRRRIRLFGAAVVGAATHKDYLVKLGMDANFITMGYNTVDNAYFQTQVDWWRCFLDHTRLIPEVPFFLSVCRFVIEKNLLRLIDAFAAYRERVSLGQCWNLVLCGDGPLRPLIEDKIRTRGCEDVIYLPGFLQAKELAWWYAHASAFVLPSVSEPWGLVANEAANARLPLLISSRAGCAQVLVPTPDGVTGARFDPLDTHEISTKLEWITTLTRDERRAIGYRAIQTVSKWGPNQFAQGVVHAVALGHSHFASSQVTERRKKRTKVDK
jgi:glycosyltransferase involved in cell wall biosynthesis